MQLKHDQLLTARNAAGILNVSVARIYELVRNGTVPAVHLGRQIRFSREALETWIAEGGRALVGGWRRAGEPDRD